MGAYPRWGLKNFLGILQLKFYTFNYFFDATHTGNKMFLEGYANFC